MSPPRQQAMIPPQNLEAEESVLGAMMISPNAVEKCAEMVAASDFYRQSHALVFTAALALWGEHEPVDVVTITDWLERAGKLEEAGGRVRLHELAALVPATANVGHWARIVHEKAILRSLIRAGGEIARFGWEGDDEAALLIEKAEAVIFDLAERGSNHDLAAVHDTVRIVYDRLLERSQSGRSITGLATGFKVIDDLTSGFQPGNLIVAAARPSMGKSALALCMAANVVLHQGLPVALFTLEMSRSELVERLLSCEALVESQRIRNGQLEEEQWRRVTAASGRIENAPLYIDDSGLLTMAELRSKARRHKLRHPDLALIIVDYLQLMAPAGSEENRVQQVSLISRGLKVLAGELDVPVLALSQLSRGVEGRHDKRPILADLRDSGSIEQDADVVLFLYRDEYYNPEEAAEEGTAGIAEVNIAKQRNGPTETVKLSFVKRYARFSELALPGMNAPQ